MSVLGNVADESHYYEQEIAPTEEVNGEPTECAYEVVCHGSQANSLWS